MEIEGMIIRDLGPSEGISKAGNPWKKHEWLLETAGQFPRKVKFTVFGDRTNTVTFEVGKSYIIQVDVESREFNERWYTDLTAYSARQTDNTMNMQQNPETVQTPQFAQPAANSFTQPAQPAANPFGTTPDFSQSDSQEDLPF